jgi:hypothetical protein
VVILHAFLALLAGYATVALLVIGMTALLTRLTPGWVAVRVGSDGRLNPAYAFVNLSYSFLAAVAGGYVTALIANGNPLVNTLVLALVVLAMAALSALQSRGKQPIWYALTLVSVMPIGVLAGGLVRLRVLGIL